MGKHGEKDVNNKSDKEKIKGATMTTPKKVGTKYRKCVAATDVENFRKKVLFRTFDKKVKVANCAYLCN